MQRVLVVLSLAYLTMVAYLYRRVQINGEDVVETVMADWISAMDKRQAARGYLDAKEVDLMTLAREAQRQRAKQRQSQTQPSTTFSQYNTTQWLRMEEYPPIPMAIRNDEPATMEELCGFFAQNSSLTVPNSYPRSAAVGPSSRVLITGILSPIGMHLALRLHQRCGVKEIIGVDSAFPSTMLHRLQVMERTRLLHSYLPRLAPIITSHVGLNPLSNKRPAHFVPSTLEVDWVAEYRPTHIVHLANYDANVWSSDAYRNTGHPYVHASDGGHSALYSIRQGPTAMEQLLLSMAAAEEKKRPQFVYVSAGDGAHQQDRASALHQRLRLVDEALAAVYAQEHGVVSTAVRLPSAVFGPWGHGESDVYQRLEAAVRGQPLTNRSESSLLDLVYVGDVVDGVVAAMQFRSTASAATAVELPSRATLSTEAIQTAIDSLRAGEVLGAFKPTVERWKSAQSPAVALTRQYLEWYPRTSIEHGLVRTLAWHWDHAHPFGAGNTTTDSTTAAFTGDKLLERHFLATCPADDVVCHVGPRYMPCSSECAVNSQCTLSLFDDLLPLTRDVTGGCDVVLYTQLLDNNAVDMQLPTTYMDDGDPLVCTVAFVSFESPLVDAVIHKVPDQQMARLGVIPRPEDEGKPDAIHQLKKEKLNGRLLYLGWILVWPSESPVVVSQIDTSLLKLAPGRLFSDDVQYAVHIEQNFGVAPKPNDVLFLITQMRRSAIPKHVIRRKTPPKAKYLIPAEPEKCVALLVSELRYRESSRDERLPSDAKVTLRQATRFMRFENGEEPLKKEVAQIKRQREFYERVNSFMNREAMRSPDEPLHKFELSHWARTRWVVHDLRSEHARQLRCDWFQEHIQWGTDLDQLSFAYVMARRELQRRIVHDEIDDRIKKILAEKTELKRALTDTFEWSPLQVDDNRGYSLYTEVETLPPDAPDATEEEGTTSGPTSDTCSVFARIISDRTLSLARKAWNKLILQEEA